MVFEYEPRSSVVSDKILTTFNPFPLVPTHIDEMLVAFIGDE